jgi:hypothetical protein
MVHDHRSIGVNSNRQQPIILNLPAEECMPLVTSNSGKEAKEKLHDRSSALRKCFIDGCDVPLLLTSELLAAYDHHDDDYDTSSTDKQ